MRCARPRLAAEPQGRRAPDAPRRHRHRVRHVRRARRGRRVGERARRRRGSHPPRHLPRGRRRRARGRFGAAGDRRGRVRRRLRRPLFDDGRGGRGRGEAGRRREHTGHLGHLRHGPLGFVDHLRGVQVATARGDDGDERDGGERRRRLPVVLHLLRRLVVEGLPPGPLLDLLRVRRPGRPRRRRALHGPGPLAGGRGLRRRQRPPRGHAADRELFASLDVSARSRRRRSACRP